MALGLYAVGLVALVVASIWWSRLFLIAFALYVGVPGVWLLVQGASANKGNADVLAQRAEVKADEPAFAEFCKGRQRKLLHTAALDASRPPAGRSVVLTFDSKFANFKNDFNAGQIAGYLSGATIAAEAPPLGA